MLKLFITKIDPETDINKIAALLPDIIEKQYARITNIDAKRQSLTGAVLLRYALKTIFHLDDYEIEKKETGKPYLKHENIYYNISHSREYVVLVIGDEEVGIDVEKVTERNYSGLANKYFTDTEREGLKNSWNFFALWTKKESYVKLTGTGLGSLKNAVFDGINQINSAFVKTYSFDGYCLSVAKASPAFPQGPERVTLETLMNFQPFLIFADLDGTLLSDEKTIGEKSKEVIRKLSERGHRIVLSTGRPFYTSRRFYDELSLDTVIVNRNGAYIHHPIDLSVEFSLTMNREDLRKMTESNEMEFIQELYFESGRDLYIYKGHLEFFSHFDHEGVKAFFTEKIPEGNGGMILADNDKVTEIENLLKLLPSLRYDLWRHDGRYKNTLFELYPKDTDKSRALSLLCEFYQIPDKRTIAFGNETNDLNMITAARFGVTVANASERVKEQAKYVSDASNNEDAVGFFLENFFELS